MIIELNIKKENTYYKIFEAVKIAFAKLNSNTQNAKGRPRKYSDEQIVCCMLYGVKNSIFSLRELEYQIKQDHIFKSIIQINDVPDYSTLSLRVKNLEKHIYYGVYAMFVELIDPETRLCAIDGAGLRSSKYDSEAKSDKGTRLGYFKGYKLHCIATVTDIIIPLLSL
ncbi:MAG: transposase [Clostridium sp.]|nr:transposase [Clostridium sp.]